MAPGGDDHNPGTTDKPLRSIQKAVDVAESGDTILVHGGTYDGLVQIRRSGAPGRPIVLTAAGDGTATVTATLPPEPCDNSQPSKNRTITVDNGSDDWVIQNLTVVGGILIAGKGGGPELHGPGLDQSLPGHGDAPDPGAATVALQSLGANPADSVRVVHNIVRGRGVFAFMARFGAIENNDVGEVACGTGAAILLSRFSDFWTVRNNHVHDTAASEGNHFMNEGIRHSNGSSYNLTADNVVEDIQGQGRGITTDVGASFNTIRDNIVRRAEQGFSEQAGGRGNKWIGNLAEANRRQGFNIYSKGQGQAGERAREGRPGGAERAVPALLEYRCNRSTGSPLGLNVGDVRRSTFAQNDFGTVKVSEKAQRNWVASGNTWDGRSAPPSSNPPEGFSGCAG